MNIQGVEKCTLTNGDGIRCILWVSGCDHHCRNCQNPDTWDPNGGHPITVSDIWAIIERCSKDYCDGLTLSGGDPMFIGNRDEIFALCKIFRRVFGDTKTIWMYTGYTFSEIKRDPVLDYVDVIVDGKYIEEKRNINRQWCGSENQRIWRKINGEWIMEEPKYDTE